MLLSSLRWSEAQRCFCAGVFHFIEAPEVTAFEMQCLVRDIERFLIGNVLLFIRASNLMAVAAFLYLPFLPHINTPALQSHNKPKMEVYDGHFLLKLQCC